MLPVRNRLKKKKDFEEVFKKGQGTKEDFLFFKKAQSSKKNSRFGFVVSKKISKKATVRNKIKRKLREAVRFELPQIKPGIDGVLVVLPGFGDQDIEKMKQTINKLFKKAKVYKSSQNYLNNKKNDIR